jgi:endonuclease G
VFVALALVVVILRGCAPRQSPTSSPIVPVRPTNDASQAARRPRAEPHREKVRDHERKGPGIGSNDRLASSRHLVLGIPTDADPSDDILLDEREFVVSYNPKRLDPNWVSWNLDRGHLGHSHRKDNFHADESLPMNVHRVTPHDYLNSGYDRGHMCPSADRDATPEMNSITFLMTNMEPQLHELNAGPWEKLEEHERQLAAAPDAEVYIVAGGLFDAIPPQIGHGIAVARANYKLIVVLKTGQTANDVTRTTAVIAVVMPNERGVGAHAWTDFATTVDEIEKQSGYDFLARVPDAVETIIEARVAGAP